MLQHDKRYKKTADELQICSSFVCIVVPFFDTMSRKMGQRCKHLICVKLSRYRLCVVSAVCAEFN